MLFIKIEELNGKENIYYATGRRKTSIARTWLKPGNGTITVNDKPVDEYFTVPSAKRLLIQPLAMTNTLESYDITVRVVGGGISGQAGAIRHGITKALIDIDGDFRTPLKRAGLYAGILGPRKEKNTARRVQEPVSNSQTIKFSIFFFMEGIDAMLSPSFIHSAIWIST